MDQLKFVHSKLLARLPSYSHYADRTLRKKLAIIRDYVGKNTTQPVTLDDVAAFLGCDPEDLAPILFPEKQTV